MSESQPRRPSPQVGPRPEPIRFFGTTWVDRDGGYALRRLAAAAGSLAAAAVGALLLGLGYEGLATARVSPFVSLLVVVMFAACSALAFQRTWSGFVRRPGAVANPAVERS